MESQTLRLVDELLSGNQDSAWNIVEKAVEKGASSLDIYEGLLTPAMRYIGTLWEKNIVTVADEHVATTTCDYLLTRYGFYKEVTSKKNKKHGKVMLFCLEEEQHFIGLKMVSLLFEEHGFDTRFLGADLPREAAEVMATDWQPDIVALSVTISFHLDQLPPYVNLLESLDPKPITLIGGRLIASNHVANSVVDNAKQIPSLNELNEWLLRYKKGVDIHVDA
ncbi:B12-binding domain-containing protein [Priestia flexa]|uniref:cobalamin B12-binding domain-containing protein n=1 Tax=Priestia flexa TaxID=86664 RepID=UPI00288EC32F|nr:B12-binding domain-containing protein [Priestia flexa]MDT2046316.1 cobalamin-dependent protein [Priestia flexa]